MILLKSIEENAHILDSKWDIMIAEVFNMERKKKKPALVKFIGDSKQYNDLVKTGDEYYAFFLEHWGNERSNLNVLDKSGDINDWYRLDDFEVIEDKDNVLNDYYAVVKCIKEDVNKDLEAPKVGKEYQAIAVRSEDGLYLVQDESGLDYFYPPEMFEIISDPNGVLQPFTSIVVYDFNYSFDIINKPINKKE